MTSKAGKTKVKYDQTLYPGPFKQAMKRFTDLCERKYGARCVGMYQLGNGVQIYYKIITKTIGNKVEAVHKRDQKPGDDSVADDSTIIALLILSHERILTEASLPTSVYWQGAAGDINVIPTLKKEVIAIYDSLQISQPQ